MRVDPDGAKGYPEHLRKAKQERQEAEAVAERAKRLAEAVAKRAKRLGAIRQLAVIDDCVLEDRYDFEPIRVGQRATLIFGEDRVLVVHPSTLATLSEVFFDKVVALNLGGPGAVTTGGGFVGGGFGVRGALEGMAIASALNKITTKTKIRTVIEVHGHGRDQIWSNNAITSRQCEELLIPVRAKLRDHRTAASAQGPASDSPVNRMKNLTELHRNGLISDEEFAATNQRILDSM